MQDTHVTVFLAGYSQVLSKQIVRPLQQTNLLFNSLDTRKQSPAKFLRSQ